MHDTGLARLYTRLVNALSFSSELYKLRRELNARIDAPAAIDPGPRSHPLGVSRWFKKRRISIAEAYITVVNDLESKHSRARLRALRMLVEVSFHAKTLDLPLNTARVQLGLIKEAIKQKDDRRRQLELLQDFSVSSHGQQSVIRKLLDELNVVEIPETDSRLKNLDAGWDDHVHDTATSGRKNPTQLLIDAFIKGISELTIAYGSIDSIDLMKEALDAGRILGIRVKPALEFSILVHEHRFHFLAALPRFKNGRDAARWFKQRSRDFRDILDGLRKNQENRVEAVRALLRHFNASGLEELNAGWPENDLYVLPKLKFGDLTDSIPKTSLNRMHLGEYLYSRYKPILFNRVMLTKMHREKARIGLRRKLLSDWEFRIVDDRYARIREEYRKLNPESLRKQYFTNPEIGDYQTIFTDLRKIHSILSEAGCTLRILHPLEHGYDAARRLLESCRGIIDEVEIFNMQDSLNRDPEENLRLARLVNELNVRSAAAGKAPFVPVCGSDSTGRTPTVPGMGFIREDRITGSRRKRFAKRHIALPPLVSAMIQARGLPVSESEAAEAPRILSLGKMSGGRLNRIGDETDAEASFIPPARAWRYLNPGLLNLLHTTIGFLVAQRFVGAFYAGLWLFITGFRNSIADLVASRGARMRAWSLKGVNFDNVARSLFWTGFSVPIMAFVKSRFDALWPFAAEGLLFDAAKFFFIAFANGLYLAAHNTLRGFDRKVVRANFFRSVLAWPLATAFVPLGAALGIPSIVHSKIWSDVVAGFIEGGSKYLKTLGLRQRDIREILPRLIEGDREERFTALLDLLFLYRQEPRTETSLKALLVSERTAGAASGYEAERAEITFDEFRAAVMDEDSDDELAAFILSTYQPEMAADLVSLVSSTLPAFRDWVSSHARLSGSRRRPRRSKPRPPSERPNRWSKEAESWRRQRRPRTRTGSGWRST
ncbi:MAG: hypothetical protein GX430_08055 [Treponema sp.]|nr:hypothetical protein [Treponema sp.]